MSSMSMRKNAFQRTDAKKLHRSVILLGDRQPSGTLLITFTHLVLSFISHPGLRQVDRFVVLLVLHEELSAFRLRSADQMTITRNKQMFLGMHISQVWQGPQHQQNQTEGL